MSDIVAGGILGTYVSLKIANRRKTENSLSIAPLEIDKGAEISVSYRF